MNRFPALLADDDLSPKNRWRLLALLYAQRRALVEGTLAQCALMAMCLGRTQDAHYAALGGAGLLVLAARLLLSRRHDVVAARPPEARRCTARFWASCFTAGATASGLVWATADLCVFLRSSDAILQLTMVTIQAGWLFGAGMRNALSPCSVLIQTCLTMLPTIIGALVSPIAFLHLMAPFCLVQASTVLSISRHTGTQVMRLMMSEQRLEEANARLVELSSTDALTGIGNRRAFDTVLKTEWARASRDATDLSLLLIDADHFKLFNDRYGHPAGDTCLRTIADLVDETLRRQPDMVARFGGEEFIVLLPDTNEAGARAVAERVRQAVADAGVPHASSHFGHVTVSIGVASMAPRPGDHAQVLVDLADRALYCAKHGGRNQVRTATEGIELGLWQTAHTPGSGRSIPK